MECKIIQKCEALFKLDYSLIEFDNTNGCLSPRYPGRIFIPESEHGHMASTLTSTNGICENGYNGTSTSSITNPALAKTKATTSSSPPSISTKTTTSTSRNGFHVLNGVCKSNSNDIQSFVSFADQQPHKHQQPQQQQQHTIETKQQQQQPAEQQQRQRTIYENQYDMSKIHELISTMAKYARCRQRFVVPVIMFRGKYICRSATTSISQEVYGRKAFECAIDYLNYGLSNTDEENNEQADDQSDDHMNEPPLPPPPRHFSHDEVIRSDLQLLNELNVTTIVDLMVEKRKIKFFMAVSSSEKADPEHYENFNILSLPYPGCEFFKQFRDNNYMAKNLYYDWQQSVNDAHISVPMRGPAAEMDICWYDYKKWDLVEITQNYLKAILKCTQEESSGLLIHCISGWDRTPLFVSLVRLSLWADGLIHQTLTAMQMAYLTVAYDWYLFGHKLPDRLSRCEDILLFCFHVLKHISDEDFSIVEHRKRTKTSSSSGSSSIIVLKSSDCSEEEPHREENLLNFDQDSNDSYSNSNCSNSNSNSNCDISVNDNFFAINNITRRSPNPKRTRTSPISVPGAVNPTRQRLDSSCSNGSWQVVSDCGSIESSSYIVRSVTPISGCENIPSGSAGSGSSNSSTMDCLTSNGSNTPKVATTRIPPTLRKQRLNSVRAIFIQAYSKTIGLKFQEGSSMNLSTLIGTLF